jgi:hypothetical protein
VKAVIGLIYGLAALVIIAALTACNPYLYAESPAPPGRTARLDRVDGFWALKYYRMELSTGVAVALTCYRGGPCEHVKVTSDDPAVAEVRTASLGVLDKNYFTGEAKTASAFVVVGKASGHTTVHLVAEEGERDVVVTVVPPPAARNIVAH